MRRKTAEEARHTTFPAVSRVTLLHFLSLLVTTSSELLRSSIQDRHLSSDELPLNATYFDIDGVIETDEDPHERKERKDSFGHVLQPRIVGGSSVVRGKYPYFVRVDKNGWPACGGSLVAPDVVLIAGHCQMESPKELTVVVNGYHDNQEVNRDQRFRGVKQIVVHPGFHKDSVFYDDMMLLKFDKPVYDIPLVELNRESDRPWSGEEVTVMGLGALTEDGSYPDTLQAVKVGVIDYQTCNSSYARANLGPLTDENMLCAGQRTGLKDSCQGDSGGPLIDWRGFQVGIVSFGLGCGREDFPGVYVRTAVRGRDDWLGKTLCELTETNALDEWCSKPLKIAVQQAQVPTPEPTRAPTPRPTPQPATPRPTLRPTPMPTPRPTLRPTPGPSPAPTSLPTSRPTHSPTPPFSAVTSSTSGGCSDAPDSVKFQIGAFHGDKDCLWLRSSHAVIIQWSCSEGSDAWRLCKATCGKCS